MGKKSDLSDFEHGMVFDISGAGCVFLKLLIYSNFSHKIISRIYRDWSEREKGRGEVKKRIKQHQFNKMRDPNL